MLKIIWIADAVLLAISLGFAGFATGQDAAGRSVLLGFVALFAGVLIASVVAHRSGSPTIAMVLGLIGLVTALAYTGLFVRSLQRGQSQATGSAFWDATVQRQLAQAISEGDTTAMRVAVAAGADVNAEGRDHTSPLMFAVTTRPDVVAALIKLGADPRRTREGVLSPLALAINAPDPAFQQLLENGADANSEGDIDAPIVFNAIRSSRASRYFALVEHGADVRALDGSGRTTLMAAAESSEWKIVLDLLARGVDAHAIATDGTTLIKIVERSRESYNSDADFQQVVAKLNTK